MMARVSQAYEHNKPNNSTTWCRIVTFCAILFFTLIIGSQLTTIVTSDQSSILSGTKKLNILTWNVAAINNNPFEYWITNDDPSYNQLMKNVSNFIEQPGSYDIPIKDIFSDKMFEELAEKMTKAGWNGVNETRAYWNNDYKNRKIISEFIKDNMIGKKRLTSMPDRVTNTIHTSTDNIIMRPTVINCYNGDLSTINKWWIRWLDFYFIQPISINKDGKPTTTYIYNMITDIKKSKYPDITIEEANVSKPLQTLTLALFDTILIHMMNTINTKTWQYLRNDICFKLNLKKNERTIEILETIYKYIDIQFLQEVAGNFLKYTQQYELSKLYNIIQSNTMNPERDQNSFILLKKEKYIDIMEVTNDIIENNNNNQERKKLPIMNGDLLVITATDKSDGIKYLLASFHGDTNGLATKPVVEAVQSYALTHMPDRKLLFGLDANTYAHPERDQQGVTNFAEFYTKLNLNSCYGKTPDPLNYTTFHARTHLQTQLNKAISLEEKNIKGDKNPKDFILFFDSDYSIMSTTKDNTGKKEYIENMVFPTLSFPSDHGITSTVLVENSLKKNNLKGSSN